MMGCASPSSESAFEFWFVDATTKAGLDGFAYQHDASENKWMPETMGAGVAVLDYNGDNWPDLALVAGGSIIPGVSNEPAIRLYENQQNGTFAEVTQIAGFSDLHAYGFGLTAADYDNDGDDDLYLTTLGANHLLQNNEGRFEDVTIAAGLEMDDAWSSAAVFFDANRDGWLDLLVGGYVDWTPENDKWCTVNGADKEYCTPQLYEGLPAHFFLNLGNGTFEPADGFEASNGKTLGLIAFDPNQDGWPDVAAANDTERNNLYVNVEGRFEERGLLSGIALGDQGAARAGMGVAAGVVDNSGNPTLFVANFSNERMGVFKHRGNNVFLDQASSAGLALPTYLPLTFGLVLFDADLDGDLDLMAANGHVFQGITRMRDGVTFQQAAQLFVNDGSGVFSEHHPPAGAALEKLMVGRGAATIDYDRDGDLDVILTQNTGPAQLLENRTNSGSWIHLLLVGNTSNRDGLGAQVTVFAEGAAQHRYIRSGGSYLSHSEGGVHFGLGQASQVDSLVVNWPSGQQTRLTGIETGRAYRLAEATGSLYIVP